VTKRFEVATADQHGRKTLAAAKLKKLQPHKKDAERRDKKESVPGRTRWLGRPCEKLPRPAMLKTAPLDCEKKKPLRKRGLRERKVRTPEGGVPDNVRDVSVKAHGRPVPQKKYRLGYPSL